MCVLPSGVALVLQNGRDSNIEDADSLRNLGLVFISLIAESRRLAAWPAC